MTDTEVVFDAEDIARLREMLADYFRLTWNRSTTPSGIPTHLSQIRTRVYKARYFDGWNEDGAPMLSSLATEEMGDLVKEVEHLRTERRMQQSIISLLRDVLVSVYNASDEAKISTIKPTLDRVFAEIDAAVEGMPMQDESVTGW